MNALVTQPLVAQPGGLHVEQVPLAAIAAEFGTPVYVYSATYFRQQYAKLERAFSHLPHRFYYSVKANSNLAVLKLFAELGSGFDIVSGGELERLLAIGTPGQDIVFSGVGKRVDEIDLALKAGIGCFNVESAGELERIQKRAELLNRRAPVAIRVNPNVDAKTHPYISTGLQENKFGVAMEDAPVLYARAAAMSHVDVEGIDCHIGSQIQEQQPLLEALHALLALEETLSRNGIKVRHLDLGGGFGVAYQNEPEFDVASYGRTVGKALEGRNLEVAFEPGRFLVANGGVLLTQTEYIKSNGDKRFAVVDAAMNDLIRPALYSAWHEILPVHNHQANEQANGRVYDVVGPVCESGDFLAKERSLAIADGDLLAVASAGAYGFVQSSNYNSRPRPPEVMVDGSTYRLIRRRETMQDLLGPEQVGLS